MKKAIATILIGVACSKLLFAGDPIANAGSDTLFCGNCGFLNAIPSIGQGTWSAEFPQYITFDDINDPNTVICSEVFNSENEQHPYFNIIWTEANEVISSSDTIKVTFVAIPSSEIQIIPPRCLGEAAILSATNSEMPEYDWDFSDGIVDSVTINQHGGDYQYFVYWPIGDTAHRIALVVTNQWGCSSPISLDTVFEPKVPDFEVTIFGDTCLFARGAIVFHDTLGQNVFYWLDTNVGPPVDQAVNEVLNLPAGEYDIRVRYPTANSNFSHLYNQIFGNDRCTDTLTYVIEPIGLLFAEFSVGGIDVFEGNQGSPAANVEFINLSDFGGMSVECIWHFDDGQTLALCDQQVQYTYEVFDPDSCFMPFLVIMNKDLQECRDTAFFESCLQDLANIYADKSNNYLDLYPNPASGYVIFESNIFPDKIEIFDVFGRKIRGFNNYSDRVLDIMGIDTGTYYIKFIYNNDIYVRKLLIK